MVIFLCIPCLVLVAYFLVAAVFFPKYRSHLKGAWKCFSDKLKGRKCSFSFDNKMRLALSMWFSKRGMVHLGRFFNDKKKFNIAFTAIGIIFTVVSIFLFVLMVKFLINSPCAGGSCSI